MLDHPQILCMSSSKRVECVIRIRLHIYKVYKQRIIYNELDNPSLQFKTHPLKLKIAFENGPMILTRTFMQGYPTYIED